MSAAAAPATVWTLTITDCDREDGAPCEARAPSVFSTKRRAIAALKPILLAHILGSVKSLDELAEACPDAFEETDDEDEGWKLCAGVDIEDLYIKSGVKEMDEDWDTHKWTYSLAEVQLNETWENDAPDEFEQQAAELLQSNNRAGDKRKKSSDANPKKCAKHDA